MTDDGAVGMVHVYIRSSSWSIGNSYCRQDLLGSPQGQSTVVAVFYTFKAIDQPRAIATLIASTSITTR